ncbi:hypothetical protein AVEN_26257-1 [Araneus ventricosus]|uniref:Uncharacterized protein n=1 Tax=Araneus ventricosus TaxID=182803 RepID=A0A4Y2AM93_ARAVE|nr:hypothetical protein AVEN_26257-1 [Araneus ventricosus]
MRKPDEVCSGVERKMDIQPVWTSTAPFGLPGHKCGYLTALIILQLTNSQCEQDSKEILRVPKSFPVESYRREFRVFLTGVMSHGKLRRNPDLGS